MAKRFLNPFFSVTALLLAFLTLAACSQPPLPKDNFYRLMVAAPAAKAGPKYTGIIEVGRFTADGMTAKVPIVYSDTSKPNQVMAYHYHMWNQPPEAMLAEQLVDYLRTAKIADKVVTPEVRADAAYAINGKIKRLERITGASSKGLVELELSLSERRGGKLLWVKTYRAEVADTGDGVDGAVSAINTGVGQIFASFTADISK